LDLIAIVIVVILFVMYYFNNSNNYVSPKRLNQLKTTSFPFACRDRKTSQQNKSLEIANISVCSWTEPRERLEERAELTSGTCPHLRTIVQCLWSLCESVTFSSNRQRRRAQTMSVASCGL